MAIRSIFINGFDDMYIAENRSFTGTITIGDSTDYASNTSCTSVNGFGYYTCAGTEVIYGKYIAFYAT